MTNRPNEHIEHLSNIDVELSISEMKNQLVEGGDPVTVWRSYTAYGRNLGILGVPNDRIGFKDNLTVQAAWIVGWGERLQYQRILRGDLPKRGVFATLSIEECAPRLSEFPGK